MTSYRIEDALYERLVAEAGLYDVAFFGTKATAEQSRLLNDIWQIVVRIARSARQERKARGDAAEG